MRPSCLVPLSVLAASTLIMSAAPTAPALARSPFGGLFAPILGTVGHLLPHRHGRGRYQARHVAPQPAERPASAQPANASTASVEPSAPAAGGQMATGAPLFWPQLADDVLDYVLWPSGSDDHFWGYGYNEIVEGALRPGSRETLRASARRGPRETTGSVPTAPAGCASQQGSETADSLIKRIEQTVQPAEAQRASLDDLHAAAQRAFDYFDKACPKTSPRTPTARLDAMEDRIWAARQALLVMRAPLDKFYASLSDEQKTRLNGPSSPAPPPGQATARAAGCRESNIDLARMLTGGRGSPDPKQRPGIEALQKVSTGLSRLLASSCPAALPATPVDRLDTADRRLNSMLYAVVTLRAPLDALSSTPSAEQKQPKVSGLQR
jgi:hypothetical protein